MNHEHFPKEEKDKSTAFKAKIGIWMFLGYSVLYVGFILISVVIPRLVELDIDSLNLAIIYGLGLILVALVMALIYNKICANAEKTMNEKTGRKNIKEESEAGK